MHAYALFGLLIAFLAIFQYLYDQGHRGHGLGMLAGLIFGCITTVSGVLHSPNFAVEWVGTLEYAIAFIGLIAVSGLIGSFFPIPKADTAIFHDGELVKGVRKFILPPFRGKIYSTVESIEHTVVIHQPGWKLVRHVVVDFDIVPDTASKWHEAQSRLLVGLKTKLQHLLVHGDFSTKKADVSIGLEQRIRNEIEYVINGEHAGERITIEVSRVDVTSAYMTSAHYYASPYPKQVEEAQARV